MNRAAGQRSTGILNTDKHQAGGRSRRAVTPEIYTRANLGTEPTTKPDVVKSQASGPDRSGMALAVLSDNYLGSGDPAMAVAQTLRPLSIVAKKEAREKKAQTNNEQHDRRVRDNV